MDEAEPADDNENYYYRQSQFNSGMQEIARLDDLLKTTQAAMALMKDDPRQAEDVWFFSKEIYRVVRPLVPKSNRDELDARFKRLREDLRTRTRQVMVDVQAEAFAGFDALYDDLDDLLNDLMEQRQRSGLGVPARIKHDASKRLKDAVAPRSRVAKV